MCIMDDELLISRAREERKKIFERYDKGRSADNDIDPWEDAALEIYHKMDKYGFIHDERMQRKEVTENFYVQQEREKKWLHMLRRWNKKDTVEKLKKRVFKGIPNKLRSAAWLKILNVEKTMADNVGVYKRMLDLAREFSTEVRQIDSDVNRQFREHVHYLERYSIKQQALFNVLTAYSMYNMELGYCQGMAGVAGILLMYMDDEQAFWALNTFMSDSKYAMHGLFIEGFPKLTRFLHHHDKIVTKFMPKLQKHFMKHNLDSILYSLKWFFVIFVERIPFSLCLRIWDIYMIEGERVVVAMAFTILRLHRTKLLKMKDMDLMTDFLQSQLHKDFGYDDDYVIRAVEQSMVDLKRHKMDLPPPPLPRELPKHPLGQFIEPNIESKIGRRKSLFTQNELKTTETVIMRQEAIAPDIVSNFSYDTDDNLVEDGSMKLYQSTNSLATSMAMSRSSSVASLGSSDEDDSSEKSTEVTRL
ncbi:USP6 N-terminal-like protein isoform X7 [Bradysia coprophila]|uniref:USP6 N-terminal-like protein isoform X7 n=1 Tax=Bradysia coprophila TaxID=38358 RepID=UPI00187DC022|nr:USP6 N-terminal-like protein isoform X7 [Bradysia coprophila]XP_037041913.1 USP6 N-terminal-like protein isoform X7 [Bradysia coprophila]XP_037041914.1 USP6 N-terminal-like protein isoform X7 [Bradysia coprophila]